MNYTTTDQSAWIFDVDGVLTNLLQKKVTEPTLIPCLAKILEQGDLLACNTGRNLAWVKEKVFSPLEKELSDKSLLQHIFIAGEKGAVWQQLGHEETIDHALTVPLLFQEKVKKLVQDEFSDAMFFDEGKQTMISLEIKNDVSLAYFAARQAEMLVVLEKYLFEDNLKNSYKIDPSVTAIDIQHITTGKDMGMQHILTWIATQGHTPTHFYCFGDSPADIHMGELLQDQHLPFTFVYVGEKTLSNMPSFVPVIPEQKVDKGTAWYLQTVLTNS